MSTTNPFDWVDFYKEFARILRSYKRKRPELIDKVRQIYEMTGINLPTLEKDNQIVDIDPFTVFGLFNKKLTDANRLSILKAISSLFAIHSTVSGEFLSAIRICPAVQAAVVVVIPAWRGLIAIVFLLLARLFRKAFCLGNSTKGTTFPALFVWK